MARIPARVELQVGDREPLAAGRVTVALGAAEDRPDAGHQLGRRERLREVVVRPLGQPDDPVTDRPTRGQDQDRDVAPGTCPPDDGEAVDLGQHEVQDHEARLGLVDRPQRRRAVAGRDHRVAFALEIGADERHDLRVVVHDEDRGLVSRGHRKHHLRIDGPPQR